jgi:hypothetical protein
MLKRQQLQQGHLQLVFKQFKPCTTYFDPFSRSCYEHAFIDGRHVSSHFPRVIALIVRHGRQFALYLALGSTLLSSLS